jgi:hypothetical protein
MQHLEPVQTSDRDHVHANGHVLRQKNHYEKQKYNMNSNTS